MTVRGIIVLEGPDGAGKTTLAKQLCARYGGLYVHNRYHRAADIWAYHLASLRWAVRESAERLVVIDRHWISECVYARVYRSGSAYGAFARALHRVLLRYGALYVLCAPPIEVVVENHRRLKGIREEMYDNVERVAWEYHRLWHGTGTWVKDGDYSQQLQYEGVRHRWVHYDFTTMGTLSTTVPLLASCLMGERSKAWAPGLLRDAPDVTGQVSLARVVLVGDRPSVPYRRFAWPFTGPTNSSAYLNETLHQLGVREEDLTIVNANGAAGRWFLHELRRRSDLRFIALGRAAQDTLVQVGIHDVAHVRHPQHARRFTHHGDSYERELWSVLPDAVREDSHLPHGGPRLGLDGPRRPDVGPPLGAA